MLLHSCDIPGFKPFRLFVFNIDHVFGDVNDTNVCRYNANVKLSECISIENTTENKIIFDLNIPTKSYKIALTRLEGFHAHRAIV